MASEIWDLYDLEGRKTGETWERSRAAEIPEGRVHIVCDILIRHRDGEFLLTRRDPNKKPYPGCLEASAGGSVLAGETAEEGARREMKEETGLDAGPLERISVTHRNGSKSVIMSAPGRMVSRLVPIVDNSARMLSFDPWPIAIMIITAATPMIMPNMLRNERILLLATALRLTLKRLSIFMECNLLF